jgi:DNA-binding MarR family transcriptional regulator
MPPTPTLTEEAPVITDLHADPEELADIVMVLQRCFILNLSKELAKGQISFPQYFLMQYLEQQGTLSMSQIAEKMGHTTAAATGLVDRLEGLGYVSRRHDSVDRRKVLVRITKGGSTLVAKVRLDVVGTLRQIMSQLSPDEQRAWMAIYRKIFAFCTECK